MPWQCEPSLFWRTRTTLSPSDSDECDLEAPIDAATHCRHYAAPPAVPPVAAVTPLQSCVLAATIIGSGMAFADGSIVTVAIPRMRVALGASLAEMQWVANGYTLVLSAFLLLGGAAGDRYGLRRVDALGVALFAAASLAARRGGFDAIDSARAAQGFGGALMVPGSWR